MGGKASLLICFCLFGEWFEWFEWFVVLWWHDVMGVRVYCLLRRAGELVQWEVARVWLMVNRFSDTYLATSRSPKDRNASHTYGCLPRLPISGIQRQGCVCNESYHAIVLRPY